MTAYMRSDFRKLLFIYLIVLLNGQLEVLLPVESDERATILIYI